MKKISVILFTILLMVCSFQAYAATVELDADANGLVDVNKGGLNALPTADTQVLLSTGANAFVWIKAVDDTKGNGDTEYWWSADKVFDQLALKVNLTALDDTKGNGDTTFFYSADKVFDLLALKLATSVLDDTKGNGDTAFVWSADKSFDQLALKAPLADPVFTSSAALPQGAAPTVNAAGEIAIDTTSDQLIYFGGAARALTYKKQKDFQVKTPIDGDDYPLFKAQTAITITDVHVIATGGTDISVDIQECDAAGANCVTIDAAITADTNGAEDDGALTNGAIDAGDWVKVVLGAPTGAVTHLTGSIYYVETAD